MSKGIFLVALRNENQEVERRIKQLYPSNHYKFSDNVFLISTDTITRNLASEIGIRDDDYIESGVAFKLEGSYAGRFTPSLWEWLSKEVT